MASTAPFGSDLQPEQRAFLKASHIQYMPAYPSQKERATDLRGSYPGDAAAHPPIFRNGDWVAPRSAVPALNPPTHEPPAWNMRASNVSDGHYMDTVTFAPEKINSNADMGQAIQLKRMLEGWPRENLKKIYLHVAQRYDPDLTDMVYRGALAEACITFRLPATARVLEKIFDRFSMRRDPNHVDYKKFLVYLDTIFEVGEFPSGGPRRGPKGELPPLSFPLPAPHQQQSLDSSELAQTFREVTEKGAEQTAAGQLASRPNVDQQKGQQHPERREEYPDTADVAEAREMIRSTVPPHDHRQINEQPEDNARIDADDAEMLMMLVSHLSKKGRNVDLPKLKKAFYDADSGKTSFLPKPKVKDIFRKNAVSLDDWLQDALLNRCDITDTGSNTCWIAIVEFLERVQPFQLRKQLPSQDEIQRTVSPLSTRAPPANNQPSHAQRVPYTQPTTYPDYHIPRTSQVPEHENYSIDSQAPLPVASNPGEFSERVQHLLRALKSADIEQRGVLESEEALRLMRNYNIVYQLNMDDFDLVRYVHNATHQGEVVIDSLCDNIRLEETYRQFPNHS